jgi:hypothetical protein
MNIETKPDYIVTCDIESQAKALYGRSVPSANQEYWNKMCDVIGDAVSPCYSFVGIPENEINEKLNSELERLACDGSLLLTPDRFLGQEIEKSYPNIFRRIGIVRSTNGEKVARQGYPSIQKQLVELRKWGEREKITLFDDGIFSGGTAEWVTDNLPTVDMQGIVGFVGKGGQQTVRGVPITILQPFPNMGEWVDARDFGILGGKLSTASRANGVSTAAPYTAPFSDGSGASLPSERLKELSRELLTAQKSWFRSYDQGLGKPTTLKDVIQNGFPIAGTVYTYGREPRLGTPIVEILDSAISVIG